MRWLGVWMFCSLALLPAGLALSATAGDCLVTLSGDEVELDKPGNLLDVRDVYEGQTVPGEGCWASKESCSYLAQAKREWEQEAWAFKRERRVGMLLALIVGLVAGSLVGVVLQGRLRR